MNFTKLYKYGGTKMKIRVYWKDIEFLEVEKKNELYFSKINVENYCISTYQQQWKTQILTFKKYVSNKNIK